MANDSLKQDTLKKQALDYHEFPRPGKIVVTPSKKIANQRDLALAYSPGVAEPCLEIEKNPADAARYTARGNLVGVITNGTAVLGLGDIGPLASKPVMEGKGVLFKKFAGIDCFDIEIAENDPDKFIEIVASMEPTFGGINLEDIKAPECFKIEKELRERMNIPVFHDDQHGTAIIVGAALTNALELVNKKIEELKVVVSGAGAAAISCVNLICSLGVSKANVIVLDSRGVLNHKREGLNETKQQFVREIEADTLEEALVDADMFLGLSMAGLVSQDMVKSMAKDPIIFALANPTPEIMPNEALAVRPDAIMATGRSDFPNQVNNALCFPYIFRGALDVGATIVNEDMKIACVKAIAKMAHVAASENSDNTVKFGREYLIPGPLDPRLIIEIAPAVAQAAMDSGVATRPITDWDAYKQKLSEFVYNSAFSMRPIFEAAKKDAKRIVYCEGEDPKVQRAVQVVVDEGIAKPILVGRPDVIKANIEAQGLNLVDGENVTILNQHDYPRYQEAWELYYKKMQRKGVGRELANRDARRKTTLLGSLLLELGEADGMICGTFSYYDLHLEYIQNTIGTRDGVKDLYSLNGVFMEDHMIFIADTHIHTNPTAEQIAEMAVLAAETIQHFGMTPKVALCSHSNFGTSNHESAIKMRQAKQILEEMNVDFEFDGEMHSDIAIDEFHRNQEFGFSNLTGSANLLIMPSMDAANIAFNLLKASSTSNTSIGPILLGAAKPVHVLSPSATARRIVNMTALTVAEIHKNAN